MASDRWRLIESLFHQAVDLPPNKRRDFLIEACGDDVSLRAELEGLVDGSDRADGFIETPPLVDQTSISLEESVQDSINGLRLGSYRHYDQIREAVRTRSSSFFLSSSIVIGFPPTVLANPH